MFFQEAGSIIGKVKKINIKARSTTGTVFKTHSLKQFIFKPIIYIFNLDKRTFLINKHRLFLELFYFIKT